MFELNLQLSVSMATWAAGLYFLVSFIVLPIVNYVRGPYRSPLKALRGPPVLHWFFGSVPVRELKAIREVNLNIEWVPEYGRVYTYITQNRKRIVFLGDLQAVHHCLLTRPSLYVKHPVALRIVNIFFGKGLLGVDGPEHKRDRKVAFPAFTQKAVDKLAPCFLEHAQNLVDRWDRLVSQDAKGDVKAGRGLVVNAFSEFALVTLDMIGDAGFNYQFDSVKGRDTELAVAFSKIFHLMTTGSIYSLLRIQFDSISKVGRLLKIKEEVELQNARKVVHDCARQLVNDAKEEALRLKKGGIANEDEEAKDLLSLLVRSNLSDNVKPSERMTDEEVIQIVPTFLSAGHETTSTALSFAAHSLTSDPDGLRAQQRLRAELSSAENWDTDAKGLDSLVYLDAVCREVLRLHNPVMQVRRGVTQPDVIPLSEPIRLADGTMTKAVSVVPGDSVILPIRFMNTDEKIWGPDSNKFVPERWLPSDHEFYRGELPDSVKDVKYGWSHIQTFTVGPRNCIGMRMAILEFKAVLAKVVANFDLKPLTLPGEEPIIIEPRNAAVGRPVVIGREKEGYQVPIRIRKL
ncbi:cytochrome P450 [Violaceomyces palustris]|uniref:Cytochrome P450 n=1 Tax=Violaceomyces palustris TaxID=1673888 RepID=A0ACD0P719_9BASI|nr:cytochrome P450 [Violaceomyces palustris]